MQYILWCHVGWFHCVRGQGSNPLRARANTLVIRIVSCFASARCANIILLGQGLIWLAQPNFHLPWVIVQPLQSCINSDTHVKSSLYFFFYDHDASTICAFRTLKSYHQISSISCTKSQNWICFSPARLQLSLPKSLKPGVQLRMKM